MNPVPGPFTRSEGFITFEVLGHIREGVRY